MALIHVVYTRKAPRSIAALTVFNFLAGRSTLHLGSVFKRFCDNFERESSLKSTTGRLRKLIRIIQYGSTCDRRFERL
jgi:hypothetical protein